jgi:hypothetical protein
MKNKILHTGGIFISFGLKTCMIILLLISIINIQINWIFGCGLGIFLSFIPMILNKNYKIHLPLILDILITLALFLHIGGVLLDAYQLIPFYDVLTHFVSSFIIAFLSFISIYIIDEFWDGLQMDKYALAFIVVLLTVSLGVVWEFAEWSSDIFFGTHEQWGYNDTIKDLSVDMLAGIVLAILGIILIKRHQFDELIDDLEKGIQNRVLNRNKQ